MTSQVFSYSGGMFKLAAIHKIDEVRDLLRTPKNGIFGDPSYGSERARLTDKPLNKSFRMKVFRATVPVVRSRFPELELDRMELVEGSGKGSVIVKCFFKNGDVYEL